MPQTTRDLILKLNHTTETDLNAINARSRALLTAPDAGHAVRSLQQIYKRQVYNNLARFTPSDDGERAALARLCSEVLESKKASDRAGAALLLPLLGTFTPMAKLAKLLPKERDPSAAGAYARALFGGGVTPTAAHAEHWARGVRAAARQHGSFPASPLDQIPLSDDVVREVLRLKGRFSPFDPDAPRPIRESWYRSRPEGSSSWSVTDPEGMVTFRAASVAAFEGVKWKQDYTLGKGEDARSVSFGGASENFDILIRDRRALLLIVATDSSQFYYCLDLRIPFPDPPVYQIDHDGTGGWLRWRQLSAFLGELR